MINKIFKNLCVIFLLSIMMSCNNKQQGNIEDDQDQEIRIEGHQTKSAGEEAYAENAAGEYLNYISESGTSSYPSPKVSLKLLATAIMEKNEEAKISSNSDLQNLARLNIEEEYQVSESDFTTIIDAFKQSFKSGAFESEPDMEDLEQTLEEMNIEKIKDNQSEESEDFFDSAGKVLTKMDIKGN